jgi:hypothetical protein
MVTRSSSRGNKETKPEWARLAASTPPLSSPYFLMTPTTNAGVTGSALTFNDPATQCYGSVSVAPGGSVWTAAQHA